MKAAFLRLIAAFVLCLGASGVTLPAQARTPAQPIAPAQPAPDMSPAEMLNVDGTLALTSGSSGSLDLSGWDVSLDPTRGPVFGPAKTSEGPDAPAATALGEWAGVGQGAGAIDDGVTAIVVNNGVAYVGGVFRNAGNIPEADFVATWDGANWGALSSNGNGDGAVVGNVYALAFSGGKLYVGGYFYNTKDGALTVNNAGFLTVWDGAHWSGLGGNGAGGPSLSNSVQTIAVSGTDIYVGGSFTDVNNNGSILTAADYIAKWDGTNWSALGSNGAGGGSLNSVVSALAVTGSTVYAGGYFFDVNNNGVALTAADYVARWDGTDWTPLGVDGQTTGSLAYWVSALAVRGTELWVGGQFENVRNLGTTIVPEADLLATYGLRTATPPPLVTTIWRGNINPVGGDIVQYGVQFSKSVTGVDAADFVITTTGLTGSSINSVSGSGTAYTVMVNVGTGSSGTLRLDLVDNDTIVDGSLQPLGGVGVGNGNFTTGEVYTIDRAFPTVSSITRVDSNPTRDDVVHFLVTFSRAVSPVALNDFEVTSDGLTGATVTGVSGSGTGYTVTVATGSGSGTLRLDLIDNDTIRDDPFNPLGGPGYLNGNYSAGESYDVRNRWVYLPLLRH